jgi:hypothetical protein
MSFEKAVAIIILGTSLLFTVRHVFDRVYDSQRLETELVETQAQLKIAQDSLAACSAKE